MYAGVVAVQALPGSPSNVSSMPHPCSFPAITSVNMRGKTDAAHFHAGSCDQAWYCSTACKEEHWNHGQIGAACRIPHRLICPTLSFFGSSKCDADLDSVLHMCLDALALQSLQHPEAGSSPTLHGKVASQSGPASLAVSQQNNNHMLPAQCLVCKLGALRAVWFGQNSCEL